MSPAQAMLKPARVVPSELSQPCSQLALVSLPRCTTVSMKFFALYLVS